jgi:hypothetical protein
MPRLIQILSISALTIFATASASAATITYNYIGNDYTRYSASTGYLDTPFTLSEVQAAAQGLGPRLQMTATVDVTVGSLRMPLNGVFSIGPFGVPDLEYEVILKLTSGLLTYEPRGFTNGSSLTFTNGAITAWNLDFWTGGCFFPLTLCTFESSSLSGDRVLGNLPYPNAGFATEVETTGTWSLVAASPVPGPIVGAGLPGLLVAVAGFIGWRRSRRAIAA